jgi:hypothetical protein
MFHTINDDQFYFFWVYFWRGMLEDSSFVVGLEGVGHCGYVDAFYGGFVCLRINYIWEKIFHFLFMV